MMIQQIIDHIKQVEHGFNHIIDAGNQILAEKNNSSFEIAVSFMENDSYQVRMLATYILGQLSPQNNEALTFLETKSSLDPNWRVQEMLAKAFDYYCSTIGYEQSLPKIKSWLTNPNSNIKRAVIEGLRIWTGRPYFKENPQVAINLISKHRSEDSEYLRKSVGNSLRDISKKHPTEIDEELSTWNISDKNTLYTYKLVKKGTL
ncbi:DNA alkylation repair protein [Chryseobacterium sp. Ch-15]|uniref:DNA alkylation repair protein n=1 Tax=Chryseobacterium muglaense TaxID=2893752 RepID=A0A9Q3USG1_9FLAO|nr:DNA alkylation repair protein [Chryseobacterium muglaense]MBD3907251.1 DNA alkylation repair protein [Chryseobacterium muglaense]MCC9033168.1 DNA alkylation repair protein [Chryseobacterium muglaense]MCM2556106.1 DNA alkylation repair protein [Chryseobacterium muglaense]